MDWDEFEQRLRMNVDGPAQQPTHPHREFTAEQPRHSGCLLKFNERQADSMLAADRTMSYDSMHILLVDDNAADRRMVGLVLEDTLPGIHLAEVDTPTSLVDRLLERQFDAAIISRRIGWAEGLEVLRTVRRFCPGCPIFFMSAEPHGTAVAIAPCEGADECFRKDSAGYLLLADALRRHLSRRAGSADTPVASVEPQADAPWYPPENAGGSGRLVRRRGGPSTAMRPRDNGYSPSPGSGVVRLLQLTDTHLYADPNGKLLGQNTRKTFELVLDLVFQRFWPVDRLLLTGDLVHDESREGYRYLKQRLSELETPCNCLPGNHDAFRVLVTMLNGSPISFAPSVRVGAWNLVFLDSTVPGADGGHLGRDQLEELEETLRNHRSTHTLVCLHHQPVPVGSAWLDTMALDNPKDFFAIVDRHPQVRGIIWGHIHQEYQSLRKDVLLLASPSTCVQFQPNSNGFALDPVTPGFRWLELHADGRIDTGIERIDAYPDPIDLSTGGY